ncbi:MAG TPA: PRC-barrel domain-containing protein [Solirubrobacterales bacterium]|nr:PRC-barrel domain-containing protein [Solirubrobacterales bacterium]
MTEAAALPSAAEVGKWIGAAATDLDGAKAGEVQGFYLDAESGEPAWLVLQLGRWRNTRLVAVPLRECAGAAFGVWVAQKAEALRTAPVVDPSRPLRREHELTICAHYGIGESVGRAAEVAGRPEGVVTASPLS